MSSNKKKGNKKGCGYIRKRGKHFYWRRRVNGKEINKRILANSLEEAEKEIERLITISKSKTEIEVAVFTARANKLIQEVSSLSLDDAFEAFEKNPTRPDCLPDAVKRNKLAWNEFLACVRINNPNARTMIDITANDAEDYAISIANMSPGVYNKRIGSLKLIFKILKRQSGLSENPFQLIRRKALQAENKKELTNEQLVKVFESVDGEYPFSVPHREDVKILFRIGAYTGMRLKDCCLLKLSEIDFKKNTIAVKPSKTKKTNTRVTIPIHADLLELLEKVDKNQEYALPGLSDRYNRNPSGVTRTTSLIIWYALNPENGNLKHPALIKGYGFHSLRHSFVSFCANAGVPLAVVQEIVGHNNVAVTHIYSHLSLDTLRAAVAAVPGKVKKKNKIDIAQNKRLEELMDLLKNNPDLVTKTLENMKKH